MMKQRSPYETEVHGIQKTTWPEHAAFYSPGFEVLPAVTFLKTSGTRSLKPIELNPPHLIALEKEGSGQPNRAFFMPVFPTTIPPARITKMPSGKDNVSQFRIEVNGLWKGITLSCAWIPLVMNEFAPMMFESDFSSMDGQSLKDLISIKIVDGNKDIPICANEIRNKALHPMLRGIAFPMTYARRALEQFLFTIDIKPRLHDKQGQVVGIPETFMISFAFTKQFEAFVKKRSRIPNLDFLSFDIIPNAIPCTNMNYQYWHSNDTYEDFQSTLSERPLGIAGLLPFKIQESLSDKGSEEQENEKKQKEEAFLKEMLSNRYKFELIQKKESGYRLVYSDSNPLKAYDVICSDGKDMEALIPSLVRKTVVLMGTLAHVEAITIVSKNDKKTVELTSEQKRTLNEWLPGSLDALDDKGKQRLMASIAKLLAFEYQCLYIWVSLGDKINGDHFKTPRATDAKLQFLQLLPNELSDLQTAVPCTHGTTFFPHEASYHEPVLMGFMPNDWHFLNEMTLMASLENLLSQLGCLGASVRGPSYELAVVDGLRQRVTALEIVSAGLKDSVRMALQQYVQLMVPIGIPLLLKFVDNVHESSV